MYHFTDVPMLISGSSFLILVSGYIQSHHRRILIVIPGSTAAMSTEK